jgi:7-keto-8-aminopelargonate synthetase-like enzyme
VTSDTRSPIIFLQLSGKEMKYDFSEQLRVLDRLVDKCLTAGVAVVSTGHHVGSNQHTHTPPAIRLTVSAAHTKSDMDTALATLKSVALSMLNH